MVHNCPRKSGHEGTEPRTDAKSQQLLYGAAILSIEQIDGRWFAHNEEYATEVSFCPWGAVDLYLAAEAVA